MSIIITCGHQHSEYVSVHRMLAAAGVADALPSLQRGYSPTDLSQMMCDAHQIDASDCRSIAQIEPGKAWLTLAADLIVANLNLKHWGWADSNCIYFLEFWRDFDPRVHFVLVYSSPNHSVARLIATQEASPDAVHSEIMLWKAFNEEILRFYYKNKNRCVLVNSAALANPTVNLGEICAKRFELDFGDASACRQVDWHDLALETLAASALTEDAADAQQLCQEMETAADAPDLDTHEPKEMAYRAWQQQHDLQARLERALELSETSTAEKEAKLVEDAEGLSADNDTLGQEMSPQRFNEEDANQLDLRKENDLLLRQLHNVQEELEHYFLMYQELLQSGQSKPAEGTAQTDQEANLTPGQMITIDMRKSIDGENWEYCEHDGRWAGPGTVSTIRLPRLPEGRYRIQLDVVDAIAPTIIRDLELRVNGAPIRMKRRPKGLKGPLAGLKRAYMILRDQVVYPLRLTGQMEIDGSNGGSALMLELRFPELSSPAAEGQTNRLGRTLRLKKIQITRIGHGR